MDNNSVSGSISVHSVSLPSQANQQSIRPEVSSASTAARGIFEGIRCHINLNIFPRKFPKVALETIYKLKPQIERCLEAKNPALLSRVGNLLVGRSAKEGLEQKKQNLLADVRVAMDDFNTDIVQFINADGRYMVLHPVIEADHEQSESHSNASDSNHSPPEIEIQENASVVSDLPEVDLTSDVIAQVNSDGSENIEEGIDESIDSTSSKSDDGAGSNIEKSFLARMLDSDSFDENYKQYLSTIIEADDIDDDWFAEFCFLSKIPSETLSLFFDPDRSGEALAFQKAAMCVRKITQDDVALGCEEELLDQNALFSERDIKRGEFLGPFNGFILSSKDQIEDHKYLSEKICINEHKYNASIDGKDYDYSDISKNKEILVSRGMLSKANAGLDSNGKGSFKFSNIAFKLCDVTFKGKEYSVPFAFAVRDIDRGSELRLNYEPLDLRTF